ncbi:MAG: trypsin-like peptidase domain-containing protein [Armatimonadota bacterium]|nr:trypsin-like peptidase domain-containing protein [Armatimonadota bacterium]MDR7447932.1 trypsin-like peptidase domain-containing protein [Armatimonadota bacterium]MDR7458195.1 trypsin-like peptidase domain-containing protein [Armatimonadota bacterium]MDR7478499.1 trypsin-like peptidase domain-containing protein [Armatimonadota bacterium]MDR7488746.1 trypsin-like peptidase domain-containing protein [Armatimonadota bacterium]
MSLTTRPRRPAPGFTFIVLVLLVAVAAGAALGATYLPRYFPGLVEARGRASAPGQAAPGGTAPGGSAPGGVAPGGVAPGGSAPGVAPPVPPMAAPAPAPPGGANMEATIVRVVEMVRPAVVNINTRAQVPTFFGVYPQEGAGSGVIVRSDGLILTNHHVIQGAQEITVTLVSGQELRGRVVGADPFTDLAVIKVDGQRQLPVVQMGTSRTIKVGQLAIAIGNPFGLGSSVTVGVVSALNRSIQISPNFVVESLIQTDAAINPGNSGGALVDSSGRLIGINTAIVREAQGIGFAIPVDIAQAIMRQLITQGRVVRPALGIILGGEIDPQIARAYNLPVDYGVLVADVPPGGPAAAAGIRPGDIIVAINGRRIENINELRRTLFDYKPGDRVRVEVVRDGRRLTVTVTLTELRT